MSLPPPLTPRKTLAKRTLGDHTAPTPAKLNLPAGNELIVRGIIDPQSLKPRSNIIEHVTKVIRTLAEKSPSLQACPVQAHAFSSHSDSTPSAYISFTPEFLSSQTSPRFDLLENWKMALDRTHEPWQVAWAPARRGKDKRCWVRFPSLVNAQTTDKKGDADVMSGKIAEWYPKNYKGHVVAHFGTEAGPIIVLASPKQADELTNSGQILMAGIANGPVQVVAVNQIEINNAFELIISGLGGYVELASHLTDWISSAFQNDTESLFCSCRTPSNTDLYIFTMRDWEATKMVLDASEKFTEYFKNSAISDLAPPILLHEFNSKVRKRNLNVELQSGANQLLQQIKTTETNLNKRIDALETSTREAIETTQKQMATVTQRLLDMGQGLDNVNAQIRMTSASLEHMQTQQFYRTQILSLDDEIRDCRNTLHHGLTMGMNQLHEAELQTKLTDLENKKTAIANEMKNALESIMQPKILGPPTNNDNAANPSPPQQIQHRTPSPPPAQPPTSQPQHPRATSQPAPPPKRSNKANRTNKKRKVTGNNAPQEVDQDMEEEHATHPERMEEDLVRIRSRPRNRLTAVRVPHYVFPVTPTRGNSNPFEDALRKGRQRKRGERNTDIGITGVAENTQTDPKLVHTHEVVSHSIVTHSSLRPSHQYTRPRYHYALFLYICLLTILMCVSTASATPHLPNNLSIYALNANGLVHPTKVAHVNAVIANRKPHVFVISETKTNSSLRSKLPFQEYEILEEPGIGTTGHHIFKWGMVIGIRKDVQILQRLANPSLSTTGRLIAADLVLPTAHGTGFTHRMIGCYAPWNPGGDHSEPFWNSIRTLCNDADHSWTIAGDLNTTVTRAERATDQPVSRHRFLDFLQNTQGIDLWDRQPNRCRRLDWTCKARGDDSTGGNIIDRIVTSSAGYLDSYITTTNRQEDYVPMTDHRGIQGNIVIAPPHHPSTISLTDNYTAPHRPLGRIRYPSRKDKHLFQQFQDMVDDHINSRERVTNTTIIDDETFLLRYTTLTEIINRSAENTFGRSKRFFKSHKLITSPKIQQLKFKIRSIGNAIRLLTRPYPHDPSSMVINLCTRAFHEYPNDLIGRICYLKDLKRQTWKDLFAEQNKEIIARSRYREKGAITTALTGGSAKNFTASSTFSGLPLVVSDPNNRDSLLVGPDKVKAASREYFQTLYAHEENPQIGKPWMFTPSVVELNDRVKTTPFVWPQVASLQDYRAMLRRGNPRPSPGPDGWEKWCIKALSDRALNLVLELHNYIVTTNSFPGDTKDMWLTSIHKKGVRTDLANYRGILLSNFIANSPITWLNHNLTAYATQMSLIPETQIATHQGVQSRDVLSFLSGIKCWAARNKQTVYAIKRDQAKGFDRLSPQGLYDAIEAYGLPRTIADLDRAAQYDTRVFIRTAYGITDPIIVTGVTKQGGPLSPIKSALTTSLGHRYLNDLACTDPDALIISANPNQTDDPHTSYDTLSLSVNMVEAMDDSYIFAKSIPCLIRLCYTMECFQLAYGWTTQWSKTQAFVLEPTPNGPQSIEFQSVSPHDKLNPLKPTIKKLDLTVNSLEFLRTAVDDPTKRFEELKLYIESFQLPKLSIRTPLTLTRKILVQIMLARARALISLQPLKPNDATKLDNILKAKVHDTTGFPYHPNTQILTLPLEYHGADFPSIARTNAGIAVDGLLRDLNHHIKPYRLMALITLADWTCRINNCTDPFGKLGLERKFTLMSRKIPSAWITAHSHLSEIRPQVFIRSTDMSDIGLGKISISHVLTRQMTPTVPTFATNARRAHALLSLRRKGLVRVNQIGRWRIDPQNNWRFIANTELIDKSNWSNHAKDSLRLVLQSLDSIKLEDFAAGDVNLLIPRDIRRRYAETKIAHYADLLSLTPSQTAPPRTWATDGSMTMTLQPSTSRRVTAAATGPSTIVMRLSDQSLSILHGEVMALITASVLAGTSSDNHTVFTDHLNTVRLIDDHQSHIEQNNRIRKMNGRSYYRWLLKLVETNRCTIRYTRSHTNGESLDSILNAEADHYATKGQQAYNLLPEAPIPTFEMDEFTLFQTGVGWIESNIRCAVEEAMARSTALNLAIGHKNRMATWLYSSITNPEYPYRHANSAYTAIVQLYARSGQLATLDTIAKRKPSTTPSKICRLGCDQEESAHHIFVECEMTKELRGEMREKLRKSTEDLLETVEDGWIHKDIVMSTAESLFADHANIWPFGRSRYYLGFTPPIERYALVDPSKPMDSFLHNRAIFRIVREWHLTSIHLTARIFGTLQRRAALLTENRIRQ